MNDVNFEQIPMKGAKEDRFRFLNEFSTDRYVCLALAHFKNNLGKHIL